MSNHAGGQGVNERYLAAALEWLRLRLASAAEPEITRAATALQEAESASPPPAMALLAQRLGLSRFEQQVLLLCAAMELDTRFGSLCARVHGNPAMAYPTFALAMTLFEEPAWDALSPGRPLRYWRLIEINQSAAQPLIACPLRADERIVNCLKGLNQLDDRVAPLLLPLESEAQGDLPPSQRATVETILRWLREREAERAWPVVQLLGPDSVNKQLIARQAAAALGLHLVRLPADLLAAQGTDGETLARLWEREGVLLPLALYLDAQETDSAPDGPMPPWQRFLVRCGGLVFLDTREARARLGRPSLTVDVARPTPAEQRAAWQAALGPAAGEIPARLAGQFDLGLAEIRHIASAAVAGPPDDLLGRLWDACLAETRPRLHALAQRLEPLATWEDIVLPPESLDLLRRIADQVRQRSRVYEEWGFRRKMNRGLGISALFTGESGTGKTMAAEVIANDLRLYLYRIDLSAVVSKYIGETEKNLRRVFDAVEDGGAILFFDEADALFGKRTEVRDSHDRYANIEINYLLQRMEAYRGLAILATNMKSALDPAFVRRLRFAVSFTFPGFPERLRIWQKVYPAETPVRDLDYERLARLNLTGGMIHNIALAAAFLAAGRGGPVTMPLIMEAARAELRKLERPVSEADFACQPPAGAVV